MNWNRAADEAEMMSPAEFKARGYCVTEKFLPERECERLLGLIAAYRSRNTVPEIYRLAKDRPLRYSVIDGERIRLELPDIHSLHHAVNEVVNRVSGQELVPLENEKVACNINITARGGAYRWHYDRNAVTAILYLNQVAGGETESHPNYRILLGHARYSRWQQRLDGLLRTRLMRRCFGKEVVCAPRAGRLLIMRGDRCLHSVRPVSGAAERINVIMSYDTPGAGFAVADQLDAYLYSQAPAPASDPNYNGRDVS